MSDRQNVATTAQEQEPRQQQQSRQQRAALPAVDIFEDEAGITLLADMPGVPRERLEVKVEGDELLIEGSVQAPTPDNLEAIHAEVRIPRFRRSFTLSRELDSAQVDARLKDGVLTVRIPKQAHAQPRRIQVSGA